VILYCNFTYSKNFWKRTS